MQVSHACEWQDECETDWKHSAASIDAFDLVAQYDALRRSTRHIARRCCIWAGDEDVLATTYSTEDEAVSEDWERVILSVGSIALPSGHKNQQPLCRLLTLARSLFMGDIIRPADAAWMAKCYKQLFLHGDDADLPVMPELSH